MTNSAARVMIIHHPNFSEEGGEIIRRKINPNTYQSAKEAVNNPYMTLQLIWDISVGYDGCESPRCLKKLIDEIMRYCEMALEKGEEKGRAGSVDELKVFLGE